MSTSPCQESKLAVAFGTPVNALNHWVTGRLVARRFILASIKVTVYLQRCLQPYACSASQFRRRYLKPYMGGGIGFFGFAVMVTFEIGFSVFAHKIPGFSVLVSIAVFGFSPFDIRISVFMNKKKAVTRFLRAIGALYEVFLFHYKSFTFIWVGDNGRRLLWLNVAKISFGIMGIKFALQSI